MTESALVVVRTFLNRFEADVAKTALDAADIESFVRADDAGMMERGLWMGSPVELVVNAADADRATEVLDSPARVEGDDRV